MEARKAEILRAIVEEYVETAQPVGSQTVARSRRLGVSSATIRNDMTVLEREGYLVQPHTSAGRIPTDLGYRYFVDHFTREQGLPAPERRAVADFFASAHRALEDLLHETSQLLSRVTDHAAVVVGPQPDAATVRSVQLVSLQPGVVLTVAVLSNGGVEKQVLHGDADTDDAGIHAAAAALNDQLAGYPLTALPELRPTGDPGADALAQQARAELAQYVATVEPLYVGGTSRIAAEQESFATGESAARLLEMLEHQVVVVSLVRDLLDQGITVRIGAENDIEDLRDCAIVLAPYRVEGEVSGTVGVLGPTRMDYQQALAAVAAVSQQLGRLLS
ncbi:MAG TPA: heat-inducible transcriptional repressor HrcA [Acidimicrobiia bacterium]